MNDVLILSLILLVTGLTLFAVIGYLKYHSARLNQTLLSLYELNQSIEQDLLLFIDPAWQILQKAGIQGMRGRLLWFGEEKPVCVGRKTAAQYPIVIHSAEISVELTLFLPRLNGEKKMLTEIILQTFKLLLSSNVSSKCMQVAVSQQRLEKYQLFLQHDIKNIAQFVQLLSSQVELATTDRQKVELLDKLQQWMPSVSQKAMKIIEYSTFARQAFSDLKACHLAELIKQLGQALEVETRVEGSATLLISETLIHQVISHVLDNFKHHSAAMPVYIKINETEEELVVTFEAKNRSQQPAVAERVFEPFWSSSESGLGLGMFITRELLKRVSSQIHFSQSLQKVGFDIHLPKTLMVGVDKK